MQRLSISVAGVHRIATHLGVPTELVQNMGIARSIGRIMQQSLVIEAPLSIELLIRITVLA